MIRFPEIRSALVRGLSAYLGAKVIEMNVAAKPPPFPYLTYNFTDLGTSEGQPILIYADGKKQTIKTETFTVSFLSYAHNPEESLRYALLARDWFLTAGHAHLKDTVDTVVVEVSAAENRDVQVGVEWERRHSFDVDFRTLNLISQDDPEMIDTVNVKEMAD